MPFSFYLSSQYGSALRGLSLLLKAKILSFWSGPYFLSALLSREANRRSETIS